jgi:hypothetical protein
MQNLDEWIGNEITSHKCEDGRYEKQESKLQWRGRIRPREEKKEKDVYFSHFGTYLSLSLSLPPSLPPS